MIKWRWWVWTLAAVYRRTSGPGVCAVCIHQILMNRVNSDRGFAMVTQQHRTERIVLIIVVIIIIYII